MNDEDGVEHCASCDSTNVRSAMVTDKFLYGHGPDPIELSAEVLMFSCADCGESYTGEQGESARGAAVRRLQQAIPQMLTALRAQHQAIDTLFALLIAKTMHAEKPFYPSESGQPWEAIQAGKKAIEAAGCKL
jgi:hypothetical protein